MKVVSPKASSKIYKIFTIVTAVLAVLFLTSNSWIASLTYKSKSNGYNKTMSLNGYNIKVTDAAYYDNVCEFVIKCRLLGSDTGATYPEVTAVNFDDDLTDHKFTAGNKYDDYSRKITVKNPPSNFKIMRVVIKTSMPDTKYDDAYDEFGEKIPAHTEKGKTITLRVTIDRKDMQTHAVGRGVGLPGQIRRAAGVAGKISLSVAERQVVPVNGKTVKIFAVNRVPDILKRSEFGFHENLIVTVVLMAHEAAVQLDVRQIQAIPFKAFYRQAAGLRARPHPPPSR